MKQYIHYGHSHFAPDLFNPISNRPHFTKPIGGFWASPIEATYGWYHFCKGNDFNINKLNEHFIFSLTDNAKVIRITDIFALCELPLLGRCCGMIYLDFEVIKSQGIDAIEVELDEDLYEALYGWDCDSILILNPNIVKEL